MHARQYRPRRECHDVDGVSLVTRITEVRVSACVRWPPGAVALGGGGDAVAGVATARLVGGGR